MPEYMGMPYSMNEVRTLIKEVKETIKEDEQVYGFYKLGEIERCCDYLFTRLAHSEDERFK